MVREGRGPGREQTACARTRYRVPRRRCQPRYCAAHGCGQPGPVLTRAPLTVLRAVLAPGHCQSARASWYEQGPVKADRSGDGGVDLHGDVPQPVVAVHVHGPLGPGGLMGLDAGQDDPQGAGQ